MSVSIGDPQTHRRAAYGTGPVAFLSFGSALAAAFVSALFWRARVPSIAELIWLVVLVTQAIIRARWTRLAARNTILVRVGGGVERVLLAAVFVSMFALPLVTIATPLLDGYAYTLSTWTLLPAWVLCVGGLWLFHRAHVDLAANWSPTLEIRLGHQLVTHGVYARIRHPMYAAIWLFAIAQPLLIQNWVSGPAALLAFGAMYAYRIRHEEAMLRAEFKEEWLLYALRSGRLLPRWRPRIQPETLHERR